MRVGSLFRSEFLWILALAGLLGACSSGPAARAPTVDLGRSAPAERLGSARVSTAVGGVGATVPAGALEGGVSTKSRWVAVDWAELPGFADDPLFDAWNAWIKSCERAQPPFAALCADVRRLSIGDPASQRSWMQERLQPYRVESLQGDANGLLTAYFEPMLEASREPRPGFAVPLYKPPSSLGQRKPWFSRQEMDTLPEAQAALQGRAIAYLADPIDALVLQIQGSGRLRMIEADGTARWVRLAYAGTNDHPYRSVGRWLLDQGLIKDASWPGIKTWLAQNPQRQQELLWSNPRMTFFKEEAIADIDTAGGPRGSQGVALTPGRSIAVDPASIPYGTPVWLVSRGAQVQLHKLVLAQDSGSAILGAVRADYFAGSGSQAGELAGRLRQPLQMWALWPK